MPDTLWTVDAHCHWTLSPLFERAATALPALSRQGLRVFQLGGIDPDEWQRQNQLHAAFPQMIWRGFGLHPYFVAEQPRANLERAWNHLQNAECEALGEMGLDFRHQYLTNGKDVQLEFFARQLHFAVQSKRPAILHVVRAHEPALRELRKTTPRGMVHAMTANYDIATRYLDLGLYLSIGAKLLGTQNLDLVDTVRRAPLERLLVESDCPDQPPPGEIRHDSLTVWPIAERIAEIKNLPFPEVVAQTRQNLFTWMQKELPV